MFFVVSFLEYIFWDYMNQKALIFLIDRMAHRVNVESPISTTSYLNFTVVAKGFSLLM